MRKIIPFVALIIIGCSHIQAQDQPYSFIKTESTDYSKYSSDLFTLTNSDTNSPIRKLTFDTRNSRAYCLDAYDAIIDIYEFKPGEMAIWLSVDPLLDKKPELSPYAFCKNNPLRYIDPDGRDEWEVNKQGQIMKQIKTNKHDAFYMVGDDGKRIDGQSRSFTHGTVKGYNRPKYQAKDEKALDIFRIQGDNNATNLFEFMADNTNVEWTHAKIGAESSGNNMIGTSQEESATPVGHYLRTTGYTLKEVNHNHPRGTVPSSTDIQNASLYMTQFPNIRLNVYTTPGNYTPYDNIQYYPMPKNLPMINIKY